VFVLVGGLRDAWLMLESLNVDMKAAVRCSSLVDVVLDQDDLLVESLLRLSSIYFTCRSVFAVCLPSSVASGLKGPVHVTRQYKLFVCEFT